MKATVTKLAPLAAALLCLPIVACTSVDQPEPVPRRVRMDDIEGAQDRVLREMSALILHHKYLEAYNYGIPVDLSAGERAAAEAKRAEIIRDRLIDAWADYRIDRLRKGVETLLGQGKFEAARELVWRVQATPCAEVNAKVDTARTALLNERVNIVEWATLEKIVRDRVAELRRLGDLSGARAYLQGIRPVRAYTVLFDEQLEAVGRTLDALKIPADAYAPVFAATRAAIAEAFADRTETLKAAKAEAPKPPTPPNADAYIQAVKDLREVLVKYGCAEAQADAIVEDLKKGVAKLFALYAMPKPVAAPQPGAPTVAALGVTRLNDKLLALRDALLKEVVEEEIAAAVAARDWAAARALLADTVAAALQARRDALLAQALEAEVRAAVEAGDWAAARAAIRDFPALGDAVRDAAFVVIRVAQLNSLVNPAQCKALLAEMEAKVAELLEAGDPEGARAWLMDYAFVDDDYPAIIAALGEADAALDALGLDADAVGQEVADVRAALQALLDARRGGMPPEERPEPDTSALEKALDALEKAAARQTNDAEAVAACIEPLRALAKKAAEPKPVESLTTKAMNEALRDRRDALLREVDLALLAKAGEAAGEAYERLLAAMDKEVAFDSQVVLAQNAAARAHLDRLGAVLADYARAFRALKRGAALDAAQKATLAVGAVYLDQPQVLEWARGLGADLDAPAPRDPIARPAVLVAIQCGDAALVRTLARAGAKLTVADANGWTAFHHAVARGDYGVMRLTLAFAGANAADKAGRTALFIAAERNQPALVAWLIDHGADAKAAAADGAGLLEAASAAGARDVLEPLLAAGAPLDADACLRLAAANDRLGVAQWLVARGADVNAPGVMDAAKGDTRAYLIGQGGVPPAVE